MPERLRSRKFWVTVVTVVTLVVGSVTGLDLSAVTTAALAVVAAVYTLAQAVVDASKAGGGAEVAPLQPAAVTDVRGVGFAVPD